MNPTFDDKDAVILAGRVAALNEARKREGPQMGDFVIFPGEEEPRRFTHDWGDDIQTTVRPGHPCRGDVSFYLGEGYCEFSGSLDSAIPKSKLKDLNYQRLGNAWFFHHNEVGAHRGVYFAASFQVWEYVP